jgi:putative ABC transport system ATP-binding protein
MKLIDGLHQQGNTIIIVTHERDIAVHAHRVLSILDGEIASDERVPEHKRNGVH